MTRRRVRHVPFMRLAADPLWRAWCAVWLHSQFRLEDRALTLQRPHAWEWEPVMVSVARCRERRDGWGR